MPASSLVAFALLKSLANAGTCEVSRPIMPARSAPSAAAGAEFSRGLTSAATSRIRARQSQRFGPNSEVIRFMRFHKLTPIAPACNLSHKGGDVASGPGLHARLLQEAEIAKPFDKAVLPFAKRNAVAISEARGHAGAVAHLLARMPAVAVHVHFDVGDASLKHGGKIFIRPDCMHAITRPAARDECRRRVPRDRWVAASRERTRARINQRNKVRTRADPCELNISVHLVELLKEQRCRGGEFRASRETHDADFVGINVPFLRMRADKADRLERIVHGVSLHIIAIGA